MKKKVVGAAIVVFWLFFVALTKFNPNSYTTRPYILEYDSTAMEKPFIPADNPLTIEGVELGRLLFYDSILSVNNTQSCGSCHKQSLGFTDGRKLSIGARGDTLERNAMALVNLAWNKYYFWDGRQKSLESLVFEPILEPKEMGETEDRLLKKLNTHPYYPTLFSKAFGSPKITRTNVEKAIAQFLRTIVSSGIHLPPEVLNNPPENMSETDYYYKNVKDTTLRGLYFRFANMCGACHISEVYNDHEILATNLIDSNATLFKVPSLLNISNTAPYMHDGRFKTLPEVFEHYDDHIADLHLFQNSRLKQPLNNMFVKDYDKSHIEEFFKFFKDDNILRNPEWSNPFSNKNFSWQTLVLKKH